MPYRPLGSLRLILALMVVLQHSLGKTATADTTQALIGYEFGSIAVLVFFVLSGFIVTEAAAIIYLNRPFQFITNRFLRIFSVYLSALILTAVLVKALISAGNGHAIFLTYGEHPDISTLAILENAFAIFPGGRFLLGNLDGPPILEIAWALRIEMLFYFTLFSILCVSRYLKLRLCHVMSIAGAASLVFYTIRLNSVSGSAIEFVPYFVLGAAVYYASASSSRAGISFGAVLAFWAFLLAISHILSQAPVHVQSGYGRDVYSQLAIFIGLCTIGGVFVFLPSVRNWIVRNKIWDRAIGEMTYPLYLIHVFCLILMISVMRGMTIHSFIAGFVFSLAAALVLKVALEPIVDGIRDRIRGGKL